MLKDFQLVGGELFAAGLNDSHSGNLSIRVEDKIYITRYGVMLHHLEEKDIIEVGLEPDEEKDKEASREIVSHRAVYQATPAKAIVHAHPPHAIALSITENKIIPLDAEGQYLLRGVPIVKAKQTIASPDVARLLPQFLGGNNVVAMVKGHGSFAVGETLEEAYQYTTCLENACRVIISARSLGLKRPQSQVPRQEGSSRQERSSREKSRYGVMSRPKKYQIYNR